MKKFLIHCTTACLMASFLTSCNFGSAEEGEYLEVIGEYEQAIQDGGYRLNLSYNGPMSLRKKFDAWADSVQRVLPGMTKTNDNIYINYMPEQMSKKITDDMFQVGVGYNLTVDDSATYNSLAKDLLKRKIPFSLNMTGAFVKPERKLELQKELLQKAVKNAREKLEFLKEKDGSTYEIVAIEELDSQLPNGPDYYDYNRRMATRVKVKARVN